MTETERRPDTRAPGRAQESGFGNGSPTTEKHAARTQALFREVNERLQALNAGFEPLFGTHILVCECADLACIAQIEIEPSAYVALRRDPHTFVVAPNAGHVSPATETVVARQAGYWVVERLGPAARSGNGRRRADRLNGN